MASLVKLKVIEGVARITMDAPPVNAQSLALRRGIWEAVQMAEADPRVTALALLGAGRIFSAGADISEFDGEGQEPWFGTLYNRVETCEKPVVAGIAGAALGGGLELALACHFRLAAPGAKLGLPEVTLGLVPGAGGTQRTPRLIGAEAALRLMLTGEPMGAKSAERLGLIDGVVEGDLEQSTLALARQLGASASSGGERVAPRRSRDARQGITDARAFEAAIAHARAELEADPARARLLAPHRVIDCIEGALLLPFETGLAYELEAFEDLRQSRQSGALRHAFFAERRAMRPARLEGAKAAAPERIGVVGAGARGQGLAIAAARAGLKVRLMEQDAGHLADAMARIEAYFSGEAEAHRMPADEARAALIRVSGPGRDDDLSTSSMVIDTMPDGSDMKADLLARLSELLGPELVLATCAATPELERLAGPIPHADRFLALRFSGPPERAGLLEIGAASATSAETLAEGFALARALGMQPVLSEPPVGPLVAGAGAAAAAEMVASGEASEEDINGAYAAFGFATPAYAKAGVADLPEWRAQDVVRPVCLAMANAGALLVAQGAVESPALVDVAMIHGYGFPRHEGGPMQWADSEGLLAVEKALKERAEVHGDALWAPAPNLEALILNGKHFADL